MRAAGPDARELWQDVIAVLIEAGEPVPTRLIVARVHRRYTEVYPRLLQLLSRGIIASDSTPDRRDAGRDRLWWYIGDDIARHAVTDLDS
jgi:hypothetical protein